MTDMESSLGKENQIVIERNHGAGILSAIGASPFPVAALSSPGPHKLKTYKVNTRLDHLENLVPCSPSADIARYDGRGFGSGIKTAIPL